MGKIAQVIGRNSFSELTGLKTDCLELTSCAGERRVSVQQKERNAQPLIMLLKCTFRLFCFFPSPLILIAKFEYNNIIFEKRFAPITNYELRITNLFAILCLLPSFILSWALCYAVRYAARRFGLIDAPDESALSEQNHKTHKTPTPLGGGLAIYFAILVTVLTALIAAYYADSIKNILPAKLAELLTVHASGIVASAGKPLFLLTMCGILVGLGLWDDAKNLNWRFRLLVEFSVAIATVAAGWRITLFLGDSPAMVALSWIISIFWIVGLINSFNMLDNMDGLSGGVAAICAAFLAGFVLTQPEPGGDVQWFVGGFFLVLTGAACGFLVHNRPPAKLFMGDCGSYTLGYLLATGAISAVYVGQDAPCQAVLAPLFVFAIPLYDMVSVIIRRIAHGKSPFVGDANHLSHRLVRMVLSRPAAVMTIHLLTIACASIALILPGTDVKSALACAGVVVSIIVVLTLLDRK